MAFPALPCSAPDKTLRGWHSSVRYSLPPRHSGFCHAVERERGKTLFSRKPDNSALDGRDAVITAPATAATLPPLNRALQGRSALPNTAPREEEPAQLPHHLVTASCAYPHYSIVNAKWRASTSPARLFLVSRWHARGRNRIGVRHDLLSFVSFYTLWGLQSRPAPEPTAQRKSSSPCGSGSRWS